MKTAVVDVGGGMRGIYAAGVLDYCLDQGITFDLGGIFSGKASSGSASALRMENTLSQAAREDCSILIILAVSTIGAENFLEYRTKADMSPTEIFPLRAKTAPRAQISVKFRLLIPFMLGIMELETNSAWLPFSRNSRKTVIALGIPLLSVS